MQAEHGAMAMAPDLDAAISSIARASLRNLAIDDSIITPDLHARQMSESDISGRVPLV
jgi:hypothetical protein